MKRRSFILGSLLGGAVAARPGLAAPAAKKRPALLAKPRQIVAVDAGHGGKDPGTIGVNGTYEKEITFAVASDLARRLEASGRYQVVLTRTDDSFIALPDRVRLARAGRAALFLSPHADEASDAMTAALAQRENEVDRLAGVDFSKHPKMVRTILLDLMHRETAN